MRGHRRRVINTPVLGPGACEGGVETEDGGWVVTRSHMPVLHMLGWSFNGQSIGKKTKVERVPWRPAFLIVGVCACVYTDHGRWQNAEARSPFSELRFKVHE